MVDGDTVDVRIGGRVERIRLLGIDTPETVDPNRPVGRHGPEASALTSRRCPTAPRCGSSGRGGPHSYDRLLAYVFPGRRRPGSSNEAILVAGEAEILSIEPNHAYAPRLAAAADTARAGHLGACGRACSGRRGADSVGADDGGPTPTPPLAERLGYRADDRLLIINCDDLGSSHAANLGCYGAPARRHRHQRRR